MTRKDDTDFGYAYTNRDRSPSKNSNWEPTIPIFEQRQTLLAQLRQE
jgi:hypothetical protein